MDLRFLFAMDGTFYIGRKLFDFTTVFIGDQMDTDIPCGLNAGVITLLVMTGETTQAMVDAAKRNLTMVLKNAGEILNMI